MQGYRQLQEDFPPDYSSSDDDDAGTGRVGRRGGSNTAAAVPPTGQGLPRGRTGKKPPAVAPRVRAGGPHDGHLPPYSAPADHPPPHPAQHAAVSRHSRAMGQSFAGEGVLPASHPVSEGVIPASHPVSEGVLPASHPVSEGLPPEASDIASTHGTTPQSAHGASRPHSDRTADVHGAFSDDTVFPSDVARYRHEDLADLEFLDDHILLEQLRTRFSEQQPYTYVGDSLVAVNPCRPLDIYSQQFHDKYKDLRVRSSEPAHIFWVAAQVYRQLRVTGDSQCVVVGGDSGAGKTETTKYILHHLVRNGPSSEAPSGADTGPLSPDIVGKLEKVNPLLELFGNAATVLNENSSRFGKLVELEYDEQGSLTTARLECFILEKFRVTSRNPVEKNFHVFYALFAGLSEERLAQLGLHESIESYRILRPVAEAQAVFRTQGELRGYTERYRQLDSMLPDVGFTPTEISSLFQALSAILLISSVEFEERDPDLDCTVVFLTGLGQICLTRAVEALGLDDVDDLESCLLNRQLEVKGEKMVRQKTLRQAEDGRDALARELYSVLFYGVIDKINRNLRSGNKHTSSNRNPCIRLLDISGFENVPDHNGFEQFVINSTNEQLHQFFLHHTFRQELQEYQHEGLPGVDVDFTDNADIVKLIFTKPEGLIPLLEDVIATSGTDRDWLDRCRGRSQPSDHFTPKAHPAFHIRHYAGQVVYTAEGFVTKNSDTLPHNLREVVQRSANSFIQEYFVMGSDAVAALHRSGRASFRKPQSGSRRHGIPPTFPGAGGTSSARAGKLTGRFTDQYLRSLSGMMNKLSTATPVFVRCIKPNLDLQPGRFDSHVVMAQLQSSGLLEVTRVRKEGYPIRIMFAHFVTRYKDLLESVDVSTLRRDEEVRHACDVILSTVCVTGHQMGHSKVFLKLQHRDQLERAVDRKLKEKEERARKERERAERERAERERAERERTERGEDDTSSTTTDQFPASGNGVGSESGFSSGHSHSTGTQPGKGADTVIDMLDKSDGESDKDEEGEKEKKKKEKKKKEGLGNQPAFDIFRLTERDFEYSTEFEMKIRRCVRLLLYVLIFSLVLAGGVVARVALVWLGSPDLQTTTTREWADVSALLGRTSRAESDKFLAGLAPTRLMLCQLLPLLLAWFSCFFKILFSRKDWPSFRALLFITFLDCVGVVGRSVFLFKVLPETNPLTAVVIGTAVCQVPAILKLTSLCLLRNTPQSEDTTSRRWLRVRRVVHAPLVALALAVQLGAVPVLYYNSRITSSSGLQLPPAWCLVVTAACSSLGWWENYAYGRDATHTGTKHKAQQGLSKWRTEMGRVRQTSFVYTGPVQMILLLALFFQFNRDADVDVFQQIAVLLRSLGQGLSDGRVLSSHFTAYALLYLQVGGTLVMCFLSGIACRLYMQRLAFAAPVLLVAPAAMALTLVCTPASLLHWYAAGQSCRSLNLADPGTTLLLLLGVAIWLSTLIINTHLWFPQVERTAKIERLFTLPHRDAVFPDLCLQCTRRQDQQENAERKRRHKKTDGKSKEGVERPTVYICATMWHEVRQEMLQLLKSLFRVDFDVYTRKKAMSQFDLLEEHSDLYDPEIHIIFDDAFETHNDSKQRVLNSWVRQFIDVMPEALGSVAKRNIDLQAPSKIPTPYGGRLDWMLPGGTKMTVHLKDKTRIRHRKRWSQILYLYYLLGYRLMGDYRTVDDALRAGDSARKRGRRHRVRKNTSLLNNMSSAKVRQADNIFIMTLDGDVDFRPDAVRLLLDRMKKNRQVAAVCGRIHPIGDGPMVWYQQFEYAVGHWLQKATEHVFGCVLCCPGCFSLFRASALMDDNVMKMYTTEPTEAQHFIQYEQGEDRWLCTLLLQQGWKIEYCAGADALTFAPETFHDFYIQRRRWSPSTMANIIDLIGSWRITVKMNDNISVLFMLYQFVLMSSSILAPGLVVYMISGSYNAVLEIGLWESYILSVGPVFLYILLCLKAKTETQINVAAVMSAVYAIVMLLVTIGTIINVATADIYSPDVLFLICVATIFVVAGLVHPNEFFCLFHGVLYFITVPSTFVFLTVFFLCNLHVVSWGTREGPKKPDPAPQDGQPPPQEKGKLQKFFDKLGLSAIARDLRAFVQQMMGIRQDVQQQQQQQQGNQQGSQDPQHSIPDSKQSPSKNAPPPVPPKPKPEPKVEFDSTYWTREMDIPDSKVGEISAEETEFWNYLIKEYLLPVKANKEQQDKISADLLSARNNVVFAYMLVNLMFTLVLLQLKLKMDKLKDTFYIAGEYEPVSTLSLGVFSILLLTQFSGMLSHRWGTFLHLIASTRLTWFSGDEEKERALTAIQEAQKLTSADAEGDIDMINPAEPDYSDDDEMGDDYTASLGTPRRSSVDLTTLTEEAEGEEDAPDYSDSGDEGGREEETALGGGNSVQYDSVFNRRFMTVRRHLERQTGAARVPLYQRHAPPVLARARNNRHYERRQNLYTSTRGAPWGRQNSIFNV